MTTRLDRLGQLSVTLLLALLVGCGGSEAPSSGKAEIAPPSEAVTVEAPPAVTPSAETPAAPGTGLVEPGSGLSTPAKAPPAAPGEAGPGETRLEEEDPARKPTRLPADLLSSAKLTPLNPARTVLLDIDGKRVLVKGQVCLTEGQLEMLACLTKTKEHESIVVTDARAFEIHSGLLALGCEEGTPVAWDPEFHAPGGTTIEVFIHFVDPTGRQHRVPAQDWVRRSRYRYYEAKFETLPADLKLNPDSNLRYDEMNRVIFWYGPMSEAQLNECLAMSRDSKFQDSVRAFFKDSQPQRMSADWVFVGSGFSEEGNERHYMAEGGYVICLANFPMAMLDIRENSSAQGRDSLTYEAWSERIPPQKSEVLLELVPRFKAEPSDATPRMPTDAPPLPESRNVPPA